MPYTTTTLYHGTLAGGDSVLITAVDCACATGQWYSMTLLPGSSTVDTFCMPYASCPRGMTTSVQTNSICATAPAGVCANDAEKTEYCASVNPSQTPEYPDDPGAAPTACA
ncbi:hypothetical protein N7474_000159 [Penicillium riverlandense]|uniref:uncharacterized protein n=1 Tax=Penicillium riverlandense TaxID=1903569 RepID=UPI002546B038|nr:uncharacterized protein N7474_000159 [Penicillium riverlandense]KAJ5831848.1 hypothetical protein N7474_000159 [Penicillium riverlandense]